MDQKEALSWLAQLLAGFAMSLVGFEVARGLVGVGWPLRAGAAAVSLLGLALMAHAELRERPRRMLRKARRSLSLPTQWAVKFNKSVPQGGVIPVAVVRTDGVRFVIDIQAYAEVEWGDPLTGQGWLVGPQGQPFKTDPVGPLMQAAAAWGATAVLWLPQAKNARNLRDDACKLMVVMGGARELNHALRSAEIVPQRRAPAKADGTEPRVPGRSSGAAPAAGSLGGGAEMVAS